MEQTSRLTICYGYSIHTQAKAQLLRPPSLFWRNLAKRTILQCFSCLQLSLSKASAKVRRIFHTAKKNIPACRGKGVSLQRLWDRRCEDETIHIYSIRPGGRRAWGAWSGGAGIADDAVPAAGVMAVLPLVAEVAAMAATVMAGQVYTWLPAAWRHDGHAEGRCRRRDDGHGAAIHLRVHPRRLCGPYHSACGRCCGCADGGVLCP